MHSLVARQRAATIDLAHPAFPFRSVPSYHGVFAWLRDLASRSARVLAVRNVPPQLRARGLGGRVASGLGDAK